MTKGKGLTPDKAKLVSGRLFTGWATAMIVQITLDLSGKTSDREAAFDKLDQGMQMLCVAILMDGGESMDSLGGDILMASELINDSNT